MFRYLFYPAQPELADEHGRRTGLAVLPELAHEVELAFSFFCSLSRWKNASSKSPAKHSARCRYLSGSI